jgi:hypothetical protein
MSAVRDDGLQFKKPDVSTGDGMYYFSWRGYGLAGFIPPVLGLVALGFLSDYPIRVAVLGAGLAIAVAGLVAAVVGWMLNRTGNRHSLYGLPLWVWGAVEMLLGLALAGWVGFLVAQSGWKKDSLTSAVTHVRNGLLPSHPKRMSDGWESR